MKKEVIVATGAASGIGEATVRRLVKRPDVKIYAVDKNPLMYSLESPIVGIGLDVTDTAEVEGFAKYIGKHEDSWDVLINGAGVLNLGREETYFDSEGNRIAEYNFQKETNLDAPIRLMNLALSQMRRTKSGLVVNITSTKEHINDPYHGPYADLKAQLTKVTLDAAQRERQNGIRVVAFQPGNTRTQIDQGDWVNGNDPIEARNAQTLQDLWREKLGTDPAITAKILEEVIDGKKKGDRVLAGWDAYLAYYMDNYVPGWRTGFRLGYNAALLATSLVNKINDSKSR